MEHLGGMAVTETCTPAECELEGGEKQLERDRDSATHRVRHMPQWFAGLSWCCLSASLALPGLLAPCPLGT